MEKIPWIISGLALVYAIWKDSKKDESKLTAVFVSLETIKDGVSMIQRDMKDQKIITAELQQRLATVEESLRQAHEKIKELREGA